MWCSFLRRQCRKIEANPLAVAFDFEAPGPRREPYALAAGVQSIEQNVTARQRRVPTELQLARGRKPTEHKIVAVRREEGGGGEALFRGNREQRAFVRPSFEGKDRRGISAERLPRKSVDVIEGKFQVVPFGTARGQPCDFLARPSD